MLLAAGSPMGRYAWAAVGVAIALGGTPTHDQLMARAPQSAATDPSAYPPGYSIPWLEDRDFLYGPALLDFDLEIYLARRAPQLSSHATEISHWSGFYSINPQVLLTLIDMRSGLVSGASTADAMNDPLAGLVEGATFTDQIRNALAALYRDFYAFRAAPAKTAGINAATFALLNLLRGTSTPAAFAGSVEPARQQFSDTYRRLFPPGSDTDNPIRSR